MNAIKWAVMVGGVLLLSVAPAVCQNVLQFTGATATPEKAIKLSWASNSNEVYEIDYADSLIDTNTGTTSWQPLYTDYPAQGSNTFWLDTGNYDLSPAIPHPKNSPMRFYQVLLTGTNTGPNPSVAIVWPTNGVTVSSNITVKVSASSAQVLAGVTLYVDGQAMLPSDDNSNFVINTCEWWNGTHTLFAVAKSLTHFEGIPGDTGVTYGHGVSPYVNVTFNNLISEVAFTQPYFEPSMGETQEVTADFAENCNWTLQIQNAISNTVLNASGSGMSMTYDWNGKGNSGTNLPDGVYSFLISAATNGEASDIESGGSGGSGGGGSPPSPDAAFSFRGGSDEEWWAVPTSLDTMPVPLALYPPGFDTNGLTIFEASPADIASLRPAVSRPIHTLGGVLTPDDTSPDFSGPSGQSTVTPVRPPNVKGKGTIGTFFVGYQAYPTLMFNTFSTPPIQTGWPAFSGEPYYVTLDGETTQTQASHSENWGSIVENADIASGFVSTMQRGRWNGSSDGTITASDVTGGIFNGANVGLLSVHCSYGTTAETDGVKHSYLRFYNYQTGGSSYCRLDDCSFGAPGTNGLKWMAILACSALNNSDYSSMYEFGRLPISNDLHLLLSASTVVTAAPTLGSEWAKNMLGLASTNGAETVAQSWFDAGSRAYIPETNHITITFRVAYWPDALGDYVSDVGGSPGTGNPLDIQKEDETVFSNP